LRFCTDHANLTVPVSVLAIRMNGAASAVAPAYFSNSRRRMKISPIGFFRA